MKRANAGDQISIAELRRANHEFQPALEVSEAVEKKPQSEAIEQLKLQASLQSDQSLIEAQAVQRVTQLVRLLEESNALLSPDISAYRWELRDHDLRPLLIELLVAVGWCRKEQERREEARDLANAKRHRKRPLRQRRGPVKRVHSPLSK